MKPAKTATASAVLVIFFISLLFDKEVTAFLSLQRSPLLDIFFKAITNAGLIIVLLFVILTIVLWTQKKREWILPLWLSMLIAEAVTYALKFIIQRPRPEFILGVDTLVKVSSFSFPSGHATIAFAALPLLYGLYPRLRYLWAVLALLIAFSRLYLGVHYLSDVVFGAMIGYACGLMVIGAVNREWFKKINIFASKG